MTPEENACIARIQEEIESQRATIQELTLMMGTLRGIIFEYEDIMQANKYNTLKRIDKSIERLFFTHHFKETKT